MKVKDQKQKQSEQYNVYTKQSVIRYRYAEFEIKDTDDIRSDDVIQKHPVIRAESEYIWCKIKECERQKRYSSEVRNPVTFYSEESERRIYDVEYRKEHRNEFQEEDDGLVQSLTS